jgi:hypothetical protein
MRRLSDHHAEPLLRGDKIEFSCAAQRSPEGLGQIRYAYSAYPKNIPFFISDLTNQIEPELDILRRNMRLWLVFRTIGRWLYRTAHRAGPPENRPGDW